jgi:hypothetical protein
MRLFLAAAVLLGVVFGACKKDQPSPTGDKRPDNWSKPGPVTFGREPHAVGERFIDSVVTTMQQTEGEAVNTESRLVTQVEVLSTDGGTIDAVAVTYAEEADLDRVAGKGRHGPVHGKTFGVSVASGDLDATERGPDAGISRVELGRLKSDWWWLGKPSPWRAAAAGQTLQYQESSLTIARALADVMTAGWADSTATTSARYMGSDGGVADFNVTVDQVMGVAPTRSSSRLTGTLSVRVKSGELAAFELDGPLSFYEGETRVKVMHLKVKARRRLAEDVGVAP